MTLDTKVRLAQTVVSPVQGVVGRVVRASIALETENNMLVLLERTLVKEQHHANHAPQATIAHQ